jgi:hypothetical protein
MRASSRDTLRAGHPDLRYDAVSMVRIVVAEILFSLAVFALQEVPRGRGMLTLAGVVLMIAALPLLLRSAQASHNPPPRWAARAVAVAIAVFGAAQLVFAVIRTVKPKVLDIATTTVAALDAVLHGGNPYALPLDPVAGGIAGAQFLGYKYLLAMLLAYAPLALPLGVRGTVLTNILLQGATAWTLGALAARRSGQVGGFVAALLYLSLPFLAHQLFTRGVNDLVAVLPLLVALLLVERRPGWAGFLTGLSIAAKLMPGLAVLPCLVPWNGQRGRFLAGVAAGLLPVAPFIIASPAAFIDNIVLFNALRPVDDTSWLWGLPDGAVMAARSAAAAALGGLYAWLWRRPPEPDGRCAAAALAVLLVFVAGPDMHHNYYLWFIPFFAMLTARACVGEAR